MLIMSQRCVNKIGINEFVKQKGVCWLRLFGRWLQFKQLKIFDLSVTQTLFECIKQSFSPRLRDELKERLRRRLQVGKWAEKGRKFNFQRRIFLAIILDTNLYSCPFFFCEGMESFPATVALIVKILIRTAVTKLRMETSCLFCFWLSVAVPATKFNRAICFPPQDDRDDDEKKPIADSR